MIIQLLLRLRMELSTPSAITEITFQYLLELEWNFWNRRRITFDCLFFWSRYEWAPAWDSWFILHHTGADLLVRIQAWDVYHRHGSLHVPDVPPLDLPVLAAGHHLCPRLGGCPHAAVHWLTVTLGQGRAVCLTGPGITLPLSITPLSG